jgi:predicted RecA/RadA family phage recombinase
MNNFLQKGHNLTLVAPSGGVVSGSFYLIGSLLVCATVTADAAANFVGQVTGVFSVTKPGSQAWTQGAKIYWDNSAKKFTTTSGGNTLVGVAVEAVGSGASETTGKVRLDGVAR